MINICHYMQDGEVKGKEMHISFDVCSTVMHQLLSLSPPPSDGVAREGGSWGARDHPFPLCKPPLSHKENTALRALY